VLHRAAWHICSSRGEPVDRPGRPSQSGMVVRVFADCGVCTAHSAGWASRVAAVPPQAPQEGEVSAFMLAEGSPVAFGDIVVELAPFFVSSF
jgi:hypothetical protein